MIADAAYASFVEWTRTLTDVAAEACGEGPVLCGLRDAFDWAVVWAAALALCVVAGFFLAIVLLVVSAERRRARVAEQRAPRRRVSDPVHSDGAWVRLVEDERGDRVVEVFGDGGWIPSTHVLSAFTTDVPTSPRARG